MTGPIRRSNAVVPESGLNYAAIGATLGPEVVSFPPEGFLPQQARHRLGSGVQRFDAAGRALMTWGAFRQAGIAVEDVRAEPATTSTRGTGPLFLDDGTPWITPGMTATIGYSIGRSVLPGPVKVVTVIDEPGRIGYVSGSCPGHPVMVERLLLVEHDGTDAVWMTNRSIWQPVGPRRGAAARAFAKRQRELDRLLLTALHPAHGG